MKSRKKQNKKKMRKLSGLGDVGVKVTVQFGQVRLTLDEISNLSRGSVVQLEEMAGDLLTVFANDKLVAKAEPVVVNDKFGIRLTEIFI